MDFFKRVMILLSGPSEAERELSFRPSRRSKNPHLTGSMRVDFLVRADGIEPTRPAWKAGVLPLNYARRAPTGSFAVIAARSSSQRSSLRAGRAGRISHTLTRAESSVPNQYTFHGHRTQPSTSRINANSTCPFSTNGSTSMSAGNNDRAARQLFPLT